MLAIHEPILDFTLPSELEAHEPPEARGLSRDGVRLLVTTGDGRAPAHARFVDLPNFLRRGDLIVVNDSETLPAAVGARRADGSAITLHLSTRLAPDLWVVEPRDAAGALDAPRKSVSPLGELTRVRVDAGERLDLPGGGHATLLAPYRGSWRLWEARLALPETLVGYLHRWGRPISYPYVRDAWPIEAYQTIFAREPGSAEMPSAARPFTPAVVAHLKRRGVRLATITLHTGVASLEHDEPPYDEAFAVPRATAELVNRTRAVGGQVVAAGTTVVRALESAVDHYGVVRPTEGRTDLVIAPARGVRAIDGLLTGFHEPKASHLAMLEAIAGRAHLEHAYAAALNGRYLWHEFGDVHLLLPRRATPSAYSANMKMMGVPSTHLSS